MTRKEYIQFAAMIQKNLIKLEKDSERLNMRSSEYLLSKDRILDIRNDMITLFMNDNPNFNPVTFAKACEV